MTKQKTEQKKPTLASTLGPNPTVEKEIPEDVVWIDDAFYIKKTRFGLYTSVLKDPLGSHFLTGATEDGVIEMSRWHLKCLQEGTLDNYTRVVNSGVVGGKL
jgi:hypothetical protein